MSEDEAKSLLVDEERRIKSVRSKNREYDGDFQGKVNSILRLLEELQENESVDGKDGQLHSLYDRIHRMENKYVNSRLAYFKKDRVKTVNEGPTTDNSERESDTETPWQSVKSKKNIKKVSVNRLQSSMKDKRSRKYTLDESDSINESSDESLVPRNNAYLEEFYALRNKGIDASDAGWAVLIAIESEKLLMKKRKDERERIKASKPWPYGSDRVQKIEDFIEDFERYAKEQFGSDRNRWAVELRNYLDGQARRVYFSVYKPGVRYGTIVRRIKSWCSEDKFESGKRMGNQREFWTATMINEERLSEYALRLQTLYESAVPVNERDKQTLKDQFMATIPLEAARRLKVRMGRDMDSRRVRWRDIMTWAMDEDMMGNFDYGKQDMPPPLPVWAFTQNTYTDTIREKGLGQRETLKYKVRNNINVSCKYCKKRGHIMRDCWKMKGLCLLCGGEGHRVSMCEKRRESGIGKDRTIVKCYGCNSPDHRAANCPVIAENKRRNRLENSEQRTECRNVQGQINNQASNLN